MSAEIPEMAPAPAAPAPALLLQLPDEAIGMIAQFAPHVARAVHRRLSLPCATEGAAIGLVSNHGELLHRLPAHLREVKAVAIASVSDKRSEGWLFQRLSARLRSGPEVISAALASGGQAWEMIADTAIKMAEETTLAALANGGFLLEEPEFARFRQSEQACLLACAIFGPALRHVPEHCRTRRVCEAALQQLPSVGYLVPDPLYDELVQQRRPLP